MRVIHLKHWLFMICVVILTCQLAHGQTITIISRTSEIDPDFENAYRTVYEIDGIRGNWLIEGADTDKKALDYLNALPAGWALENARACHAHELGIPVERLDATLALEARITTLETVVDALEAKP